MPPLCQGTAHTANTKGDGILCCASLRSFGEGKVENSNYLAVGLSAPGRFEERGAPLHAEENKRQLGLQEPCPVAFAGNKLQSLQKALG